MSYDAMTTDRLSHNLPWAIPELQRINYNGYNIAWARMVS